MSPTLAHFNCSLGCILHGPLLGFCHGSILIFLPVVSDGFIVHREDRQRLGQTSKPGLDRKEDRSDLESWGPLVLENVEADSSELVDVWVVDLGSVLNKTFGGTIGYSSGKKSSQSKSPPSNGVSDGPAILTKKCLKFFSFRLVRLGVDTNDWLTCESLGLWVSLRILGGMAVVIFYYAFV